MSHMLPYLVLFHVCLAGNLVKCIMKLISLDNSNFSFKLTAQSQLVNNFVPPDNCKYLFLKIRLAFEHDYHTRI